MGPAAKLLSGSNLHLRGLYWITAGKKSYSDLISITVFLFQLGFRIELTLLFMWVIVFEGNNIYYLFWLGDQRLSIQGRVDCYRKRGNKLNFEFLFDHHYISIFK